MENAISIGGQISFWVVFLEGLVSFFSPCVLPLIPIYVSYLAGNAKRTEPDGTISYERKKVFFHTVFFVLGISFAFFVLGLSFSALGSFFNQYKNVFSRVGGIIILLLGLYQVGFLKLKSLDQEHRLPFRLKLQNMNPLVAFVMGFTFSFAWTPCVGPALSSVLVLASTAKNALTGNMLVLIYTIGFVLPFLALGLFTTQVLNFIKRKQKILQYAIKVGGILLILVGIMTFTGWMNGITGYLNSFSGEATASSSISEGDGSSSEGLSSTSSQPESSSQVESSSQQERMAAFDFTLTDQNGDTHTLSDYKGKVVFLNFWATWCPPCLQEMPHIQELYEEYDENTGDVIFLGVSSPKSDKNPYVQEKTSDEVKTFLAEHEYTFPVVFDIDGAVFEDYLIRSLPTTFMIDTDGNIYGYVPGGLTKEMMVNIINQTQEDSQ
ncbi:redoxin domain-containing protein [Clostridiaceae bacterium NSJ-31]|uniref:Redoxin domain-containing protein n=1 Tax=Ligaoa zhengdingensis TaxID=2763658 RepID=A0A926DYM6_9FIRM|nr:cytochrome c biogenesis protein CcdA [Ligaoa zhengdingensis]MBC8545992.1 redoxin domain-containing protein [Ligaoa zhengdingensis]